MSVVLENSFTIKDIEKIDKEIKMIPLTFDLVFKNLFENNEFALKRFLISVLHLGIELSECNVFFSSKELPISHYNEYRKTVDINVTINDIIFINIELNRTSFNKVKRRNHIYHNKVVSLTLKKGDKIEVLKEMINIQLNLNVVDKSINIGEDIIVPYSIKTNSVYIDNDIVYLRYLDYYKNMFYNKFIKMKEDELWLAAIMSEDFKTLNEILGRFLEDDLREKLVKDMVRISMDDVILDEYERRTLELIAEIDSRRIEREEALEEGFNLGRNEGITLGWNEGLNEGIVLTIKSMIENKADYDFISKVTGKTIEEIKEIEESMEIE